MRSEAESESPDPSSTHWSFSAWFTKSTRRQTKSEKEAKSAKMDEKKTLAVHDSPRKRKRSITPITATPQSFATLEEALQFARESFQSSLQNPQRSEEYEQCRRNLIQDESDSAWDAKARKSASEAERLAAKIVFQIREHERENLFGNKASEAIPGPETRDMGGQFLTNKDRIEQSILFNITKLMPKGAHLHLHFNAELPPEILVEEARDMDTMFVRSTQPILTQQDYDVTEMVFDVLPIDTPQADIFSPNYNPDFRSAGCRPWMQWKRFRDEFRRRRDVDAEEWIMTKMVLSVEEVYGQDQTVNGIWARFNQGTRCFKGFMNYESMFRWYIGKAIDNMIEEKIMYTELRPMLMDKSIPTDDGLKRVFHEAQFDIIREELAKKKKELEEQGRLTKFPFGFKIIYCTPRSIPKERMRIEISDCIKLKLKYPELICGFDLVGAEDRPNHIGYYHDELVAMQQTCSQLGIEIPFLFHAGETLLDTGGSRFPQNSNLYDSVLLKAKRIGHGFSLTKHPLLIEEFKRNNICIELCPISNELLHLCRCIKEHPYPQLLAAGIPCTVNSDNPSLFRNSLSHEFYQIIVGSPSMSVHSWKQLAEWSIEYSCLNDTEKAAAMEIFKEEWEEFCNEVVKKYSTVAVECGVQAWEDINN